MHVILKLWSDFFSNKILYFDNSKNIVDKSFF